MEAKLSYIICGKLYDGMNAVLKEGWQILVKGRRIEAAGRGLPCPQGAEVIDLSDCTVTPGMIDAHVHMDYWDWHTVREEVYTTSEESKTLAIAHCAKKSLMRGFTTVRHMGGITSKGYGVLDVKRAINAGYMEGSRIIAAPLFLCSAGSHGDLSQGFARNPELSARLQADRTTLGSGRAFFVNAVREQVKYGSDFIKIMATGGFFTPNDSPVQKQLNSEELEAIITTAKELGTTVTAHVYKSDQMRELVSLGITGLEHGSLMDKDTADYIADSGVYLVPTFCPYEEAVHYDEEKLKLKQPEFREKLKIYREALCAGREAIKESHILLGYGTDLVANHQNYDSGWEYEAWLNSGMDPFRALKAATSNNARILGLEKEIGTIEAGKLADIAAWRRDLMTDPHALLDCAFVMKEGIQYAVEPSEEL